MDRLNPVNPVVVNMRKVDFNAASSYYMEQNWRILQRAFVELEIDWVRGRALVSAVYDFIVSLLRSKRKALI